MILEASQAMSLPSLHKQPAWFGTVMGTGAIAILFNLQADGFDSTFLEVIAIVLLWIASLVAIVLWPRYLKRLRSRHELHEEVGDPNHGAMLATLPAGLLVLAIGWGSIGPKTLPTGVALWIAGILVILGALVSIGFSAYWASTISRREVGLERVNGGWLIPVVMNLLAPMAVVPFVRQFPEHAAPLLAIGFGFLGIGALLFLAIFALLVIRIATQVPLPSAMAPSLWIPLAPAGVFGVALIRLTQAAQETNFVGEDAVFIAAAVASMGIGFGIWWAIFAFVDLRRSHTHGGIPFHLGWWGFVFPVAAMALSISLVDQLIDSADIVAVLASTIAIGVWGYVTFRTIIAVVRHRAEV